MRRIYVAGPLTRGDQRKNVRAAILAAEQLIKAGFIPFIPHLSHFWGLIAPHPYGFWIEYDLEWLSTCDAVLRLPGDSPGADVEVVSARSLSIPVFYSVESLEETI